MRVEMFVVEVHKMFHLFLLKKIIKTKEKTSSMKTEFAFVNCGVEYSFYIL